jgi:hypothetical protein
MIKNIGINVASKKTKNHNKSKTIKEFNNKSSNTNSITANVLKSLVLRSQPAKIHVGITKLVKIIKNNEIPSTPIKNDGSQVDSSENLPKIDVTNWNFVDNLSNWIQRINEIKKTTTAAIRATYRRQKECLFGTTKITTIPTQRIIFIKTIIFIDQPRQTQYPEYL